MRNLARLAFNYLTGVKDIRFYISRFSGDGVTIETAFKPLPLADSKLGGVQLNWFDGRPIGNVDGNCLLWANATLSQHNRIANVSTYLPFEDTSGKILHTSSRLLDIDTIKLDFILQQIDLLNTPVGELTISEDIGSLLSRVQQRFRLSQILREDDINIPLGQILSTAERNSLGQRVGKVIPKGQTAGELIDYLIRDRKFEFHV